MSENAQRVGILVIAVSFLAITVLGSIYFIIENNNNNNVVSQEDINALTQEDTVEQRKIDGFTPVSSVPTLKTEDIVVGTGAIAKDGDTVTVNYIGVLAATGDGFDNSYDRGQAATFPLNQVIEGWQKGIPGMKEGGKRRLYIPAAQAYGEASPSPLIPANSDLVFDVELIKVGE